MNKVKHGKYVDITKLDDGNMEIKLRHDARQDFIEDIVSFKEWCADTQVSETLEDFTANGWTYASADTLYLYSNGQFQQLTSAMFFSEEIEEDLDGIIVKVGKCYYNNNYAIEDEIKTLLNGGVVTLTGIDFHWEYQYTKSH